MLHAGQPVADLGQQVVAGLVAVGVVDGFEAVQVEQDDPERGVVRQ
jgi:hypothetical protein